ncbi:General negative regulator of transcription subunit [Lachnellula hyalina]|uniref:General negative regulator of transcription subunit n=1 Tax=Lachnellula hyalina TaxID=1316788 RepID=A0A8H8R4G1_9HELO|nr:General negative regulator of transcription subunit [Lachnellula hyalina]TVY28412.1 General negative regulator of transcription subunit [Lachnellula hyalina]
MAARKLQQEVDKCFKKVDEGVEEFTSIYAKLHESTNPAQKEKLEDNLKREIKKLQRLRDQIKTWAASNDVKDKGPLMDKRKLIETQMEKFKAVEKAMKTKAYSKEGLSATTKLDPKERAKIECCEFLRTQVDELETQIETLEAEGEGIQATMKKGKNQSSKADRMAEIERITERHKWHQGKLELIKRSLENGGVETEQINSIKDDIKFYVSDGMQVDFMEDEELYDELNLQEEEDAYGMNNDDRVSSQDTQSVQEETPDPDVRSNSLSNGKSKTVATAEGATSARRPSTQLKSPQPTMATLHTPLNSITNAAVSQMKPAPVPTRAPGETLKSFSAAAAAAASDKNTHGIAPLPPPPESVPPPNTSISHPPLPAYTGRKASSTASPIAVHAQPVATPQTSASSRPYQVLPVSPKLLSLARQNLQHWVNRSKSTEIADSTRAGPSRVASSRISSAADVGEGPRAGPSQSNGITNGNNDSVAQEHDESIYHLPSGLQDLMQSLESTEKRVTSPNSPATQRMFASSLANIPDMGDVGAPKNYKQDDRITTPSYYPQELDPVFDDPRLYSRIDPDTLFYVFYYKQGTYQQYLAAKALKDQSWRFHKQYQTWFQRHEEPKTITEEFEQGTYRFFDYESTWMNRRKADFKFAYKFLEDDV